MNQKQKTPRYPQIWLSSQKRAAKQMEALRSEAAKAVADALETLYPKYRWHTAFLFGSVTKKERFGHRSDIDIAVSGLNTFDYYAFVGELSDLLNRPVDVVLLEECRFSKSIIEKGKQWIPQRKS